MNEAELLRQEVEQLKSAIKEKRNAVTTLR